MPEGRFVMLRFDQLPVVCPLCPSWRHMEFKASWEEGCPRQLRFGAYHCEPDEGGCGAFLPSEEVAKILFPGGARSSLSMDTRGLGGGGGMGEDRDTMEE